MKIFSIYDQEFKAYGQILENYDFSEIFKLCTELSPKPVESFVYEATVAELEALPIANEISSRAFGGMPIQIGYCNGNNHILNCLEYHKSSELNIALDDVILLLGIQSQMDNYTFDTKNIKAFRIPAGTGIELFATTLHYAPISVNDAFRVICVLPKGTNLAKPKGLMCSGEDKLCLGSNKWLIAHSDAPEAKEGAFVGLVGENITI